MTGLVLVRDHLDWRGACVVAGIAVVLCLAEVAYTRLAAWRWDRANRQAVAVHVHGPTDTYRFIPQRDVEPDHDTCTGDGCQQIICYCPGTITCHGTANVGCLHLDQPGPLCMDCRSQCDECRSEDHSDRALDIARGK